MALPLPTYKDIVDLLKKGATFEAQERIMELREAVLELDSGLTVNHAKTSFTEVVNSDID